MLSIKTFIFDVFLDFSLLRNRLVPKDLKQPGPKLKRILESVQQTCLSVIILVSVSQIHSHATDYTIVVKMNTETKTNRMKNKHFVSFFTNSL